MPGCSDDWRRATRRSGACRCTAGAGRRRHVAMRVAGVSPAKDRPAGPAPIGCRPHASSRPGGADVGTRRAVAGVSPAKDRPAGPCAIGCASARIVSRRRESTWRRSLIPSGPAGRRSVATGAATPPSASRNPWITARERSTAERLDNPRYRMGAMRVAGVSPAKDRRIVSRRRESTRAARSSSGPAGQRRHVAMRKSRASRPRRIGPQARRQSAGVRTHRFASARIDWPLADSPARRAGGGTGHACRGRLARERSARRPGADRLASARIVSRRRRIGSAPLAHRTAGGDCATCPARIDCRRSLIPSGPAGRRSVATGAATPPSASRNPWVTARERSTAERLDNPRYRMGAMRVAGASESSAGRGRGGTQRACMATQTWDNREPRYTHDGARAGCAAAGVRPRHFIEAGSRIDRGGKDGMSMERHGERRSGHLTSRSWSRGCSWRRASRASTTSTCWS